MNKGSKREVHRVSRGKREETQIGKIKPLLSGLGIWGCKTEEESREKGKRKVQHISMDMRTE